MAQRHCTVLNTTDEPLLQCVWRPEGSVPVEPPGTPVSPYGPSIWAGWAADRLLLLDACDEGQALSEVQETLEALLKTADDRALMDHFWEVKGLSYDGFDGELVFVPKAYAEDAWAYLLAAFEASLTGAKTLVWKDVEIPVVPDVVAVSGSPTWVVGHATHQGLWLIYVGSADDMSNTPLQYLFQNHPALGNTAIWVEQAEAPPSEGFDPARLWQFGSCHLSSAFGEEDRQDNPGLERFAQAAVAEGVLPGPLSPVHAEGNSEVDPSGGSA